MLDIGWSEMAVIALLALVVIGPKDLPRVMRSMGKWARKARAVSREFQSGIDEMIREADLEDAKKALDSTRKMGLDKVMENTIDPTGDLKAEAKDLEKTARADDLDGTNSAQPAKETASTETASTETGPEEIGPEKIGPEKIGPAKIGKASLIKQPAAPPPPHSVTPPAETATATPAVASASEKKSA